MAESLDATFRAVCICQSYKVYRSTQAAIVFPKITARMTHFGSQKFSPTSRDMTALQNRLLANTISKSSMKMEILNEAPPSSTFIPLAEHQSATPVSFYTGPPVLHYHSNRCKVLVLERDIETSPALAALTRGTSTASTNDNHVNGHSADEGTESIGAQKIVDDVDVWVTSEYVSYIPPALYLSMNLMLTFALQQALPLLHRPVHRPSNTLPLHLPPCHSIPPSPLRRRAARPVHAAHVLDSGRRRGRTRLDLTHHHPSTFEPHSARQLRCYSSSLRPHTALHYNHRHRHALNPRLSPLRRPLHLLKPPPRPHRPWRRRRQQQRTRHTLEHLIPGRDDYPRRHGRRPPTTNARQRGLDHGGEHGPVL